MGLFGSTTKVATTTTTENQDRRTLAESGGVAAQTVQGDLVFENVTEEAVESAVAGIRDALSVNQSVTERAFDLAGSVKGAQPVNVVWVIVGIGVALYLARAGKLL